MSPSALDRSPQPAATWTSTQAYILAVITLVVGIGIGWLVRGSGSSGPAAIPGNPVQGGMAGAPGGSMPPGQLPGFGQQQQKPSLEELNRTAEPMLAQLKQNPNDVDLLARIGNFYYDAQACGEAVGYYQRALKINPKNPDVRTDMGTCLWYQDNPDAAIKEFETSLSYSPNHAGTLFNMGVVKWQGKHDPKGAVAAWEKLLQTNPNHPEREKILSLIARAKMHGEQTFGQEGNGGTGTTSQFPKPF